MAVLRVTQVVDDLDGGPAVETVRFGLDGAGYELDLSAVNAAALRAVLGRYVAAARQVRAGSARQVEPGPRRAFRLATRAVAAAVGPSHHGQARPVEPERPMAGGGGRPPAVVVQFSDRHANGTANG